jgi:hypothetical protein
VATGCDCPSGRTTGVINPENASAGCVCNRTGVFGGVDVMMFFSLFFLRDEKTGDNEWVI